MHMAGHGTRRDRSMNLREFAKGQECTLQLMGVCNHDPSTTVLAHGRGAGMGTKMVDYIGVHACSECHKLLDAVSTKEFHRLFAPALLKTLERVRDAGLLYEV